jgi:hypothetical protein
VSSYLTVTSHLPGTLRAGIGVRHAHEDGSPSHPSRKIAIDRIKAQDHRIGVQWPLKQNTPISPSPP